MGNAQERQIQRHRKPTRGRQGLGREEQGDCYRVQGFLQGEDGHVSESQR